MTYHALGHKMPLIAEAKHCLFEIKVVPSSGKQTCIIDKTGRLKCYLKSPPEKGKANKELVKFLSKKLGIPQQDIQIISGQTTRNKRIEINDDLSFQDLCRKLGLQSNIFSD